MGLLITFLDARSGSGNWTFGPFSSLTLRRGVLRSPAGQRVGVLREGTGRWVGSDDTEHVGFVVHASVTERLEIRFRRSGRPTRKLGSVPEVRVLGGAVYVGDDEPVALRTAREPYWAVEPSATGFEFVDLVPVAHASLARRVDGQDAAATGA